MKSLISVNSKFMDISPKELIELVLNSKYTKGIEICINSDDEKELKYLKDLVFEIKRSNLILQVHGNSELEIKKQLEYMKLLEQFSDYLNYPIVVTLHSIFDEDKDKSLNMTLNYMSELIENINNDKIIISLENLNDYLEFDRLEKEYITPIILNDEKLYFTYDIGHEIMDYGNITNVNNYMIEEIRNVHVHTNDGKGNDHMPIYKNDPNWNEIMKGLLFLKNNKYNYNIVYEYDLYTCKGENIKEKIVDYLNSIDYVSERYC